MFKSPLFRVSLRYGIIAGLLCTGFVISLYYMGKHPLLINPFVDFRILVFAVLLFFCLKEIRDFYQGGTLVFYQGMGGSLLFHASAGLVAGGGILVFGTLVPDFLASYIRDFMDQIQTLPPETVERIGKSVIADNLKALPATTLANLALLYAWQTMVIGFFISIIISVVLRRQPKPET